MYCPNCGNQTSAEQKFCRSCGLGLEKITQFLGAQLPAQLDERLEKQKNKLEMLGVAALSVCGLGFLSVLLYQIVYQMMIVKGQIRGGLGALAFTVLVACGLLAVYLFAKANEVEEAKAKHRLQPPAELALDGTTAKLLPESHFEPLPSVTERTTELLFKVNKL